MAWSFVALRESFLRNAGELHLFGSNPMSRHLLSQDWRSLDAKQTLFASRASDPPDPGIVKMRELLKGDVHSATWDGVYRADLLTPRFLKGDELELEFRSRIAEARELKRPESKAFWDSTSSGGPPPARARTSSARCFRRPCTTRSGSSPSKTRPASTGARPSG